MIARVAGAVQAQPPLQYGYTLNGKLASLIDGHMPTGNTTSFAYDGFTTTYPDTSTEVLGYDADSNVLTRKTRAGSTITYDTLKRPSTKAAPGDPTVTNTYYLAARTTGVSDNSAPSPSGRRPLRVFSTICR